MTGISNSQDRDNILRWPDVAKIIPISRSHAHALAAQGKFPKPIKLGARASGWLESEINTWLAERVAESRFGEQEAAS
tara:strand:+ start:1194 stop:1427 length:234 start_codon:yes stop_codon:yes gene_type:complete